MRTGFVDLTKVDLKILSDGRIVILNYDRNHHAPDHFVVCDPEQTEMVSYVVCKKETYIYKNARATQSSSGLGLFRTTIPSLDDEVQDASIKCCICY